MRLFPAGPSGEKSNKYDFNGNSNLNEIPSLGEQNESTIFISEYEARSFSLAVLQVSITVFHITTVSI